MRKIKVNAIKAKNLTSGEETPIPSVSPKGVVLEQNDEVERVQVLEPSDIANMATKSDLTSMIGGIKSAIFSIENGATFVTPRYTEICVVVLGRYANAIYIGSNIGVKTAVSSSGVTCSWTRDSGNTLSISNTNSTVVGMLWYK